MMVLGEGVRGGQGWVKLARHQTLSCLGERCCWEIGRGEETNWKLVVAVGEVRCVGGMQLHIRFSLAGQSFSCICFFVCVFVGEDMLDDLGPTWWQFFGEEEQTALRQGRGKQF